MVLLDLCVKQLCSKRKIDENNIKKIDSNVVSYSDFYDKYISQNTPCIIENLTTNWQCQKLWVLNGSPNFEYLDHYFGSAIVPVANCDEKYYNSQPKISMQFRDYINYWRKYNKKPENKPCLYLKDWHFLKLFPDHKIYETPTIFASDWLNEYLLSKPNFEDDYRFVYMGPKGSWTPLHADVFSSFSWSVNICGKKKWVFYPPGQELNLMDKYGTLVHSIESEELKDPSRYPNYENLVEPFILIQEVGDAVFVPSGWHHQVWNLEDTISINHNWINACNIGTMWKDLLGHLRKTEVEIADCQEMETWDEQCQLILKSVYGMNVAEFLNFIFYIADVRLNCLENDTFLKKNNSDYCFGKNQIKYDLIALSNVLFTIKENSLPCICNEMKKILNLIERIETYK